MPSSVHFKKVKYENLRSECVCCGLGVLGKDLVLLLSALVLITALGLPRRPHLQKIRSRVFGVKAGAVCSHCRGLCAGWERISRSRAVQKGVSLSRTESRDNVGAAAQWAGLLKDQAEAPLLWASPQFL